MEISLLLKRVRYGGHKVDKISDTKCSVCTSKLWINWLRAPYENVYLFVYMCYIDRANLAAEMEV